ncbi:Imm51 family immunity protein [Subtercola sp. Z020]|uniref:Imm51 family immunity protein n=1 Tax=Subtercola sp. Z020 TaxID=2080582 RepID=UPI00130E4418|nr:Imm51 family immunity protein [Subtercola sp. Z020]
MKMDKTMHTGLLAFDEDSYSLVLGLSGGLEKIDRAVDGAHLEISSWEMTGYFWQSFVNYLWPELTEQVNFDSEAGMFCAYGAELEPLEALRTEFEAVLADPGLVVDALIRGQAEGCDFY